MAAITKSADDYTRGYMCSRAVIEPNGNVFWPPPTKLRSTCEVDVTYFPFDDQTCKMKLGSWIYDGNQVDILNRTENVDLSNYVPNGEWDLIETRLVRNVAYYPCCPEPFPDVTITLIIRRKILYYLYNVILPCIMMSTLTLLVFCLPPESGEKIALGVTVLLAFSVFMLAISEKLPETSVSIPLLGIYLTVVMGITSISIVMTVVVLNLHYYSPLNKRELPPWLKRLVAKRHYASPAEMFTNFGLKSQTKFCNSNIVKVCDQQVPPRPPESGTILPTKTDTNVSAAAAAAAEAAAAVVNRNFDKLPNATPTFVSPASSASSFAHHHHHHHHHNHNQYPVSSSSAVSLFHISNNNRTNSTNFGGNTTTLDEKNQNNHSNSSSSSSKRTKYNWRKRVDRLTNSLFFAPTLGSFSFAFETINQNLEVTNVNQSDNREREQKQQQQTLQKSMLNCAQNATKSAITSAAAAAAASSATATNNPQASKHVKLSAFQAEFDGLCASIVPPSIGSGVGNHDPRGIGGNSKEMWNRSTMLNSITPYVLAGLSNARSSCGECSAPNTNYDNDDQDEDDHDQDEEEARRKSTLKLYQMRESNNESNFGGNFCAPSLNRRNFIIGKSSSNQPRHHRYHQHNYQQQQQQHQPQTSRFDSDDEYRETNQQQQQAQQQTQQQTQQQAQQQSERIGASASTCDHEIRQMLRYLMHRQEIEDDCTRRIHEWRQLSMFIDKILFWIFTTVTVFTSLLFLVIIPMHRRSY